MSAWISIAIHTSIGSLMATSSFEESEFLLGNCQACGREVLTYVDLGSDEERRRCVHCNALVASLRSVTGGELDLNGYALLEARTCGGGGCGTGCGVRARS